ncbi:MAG: UvrD-helicase domain-containing protein [Deltaproteobacteria bacterium]|nr:UvrD-helicase domain-containing protein [Deltaproteobacteria bacterium]
MKSWIITETRLAASLLQNQFPYDEVFPVAEAIRRLAYLALGSVKLLSDVEALAHLASIIDRHSAALPLLSARITPQKAHLRTIAGLKRLLDGVRLHETSDALIRSAIDELGNTNQTSLRTEEIIALRDLFQAEQRATSHFDSPGLLEALVEWLERPSSREKLRASLPPQLTLYAPTALSPLELRIWEAIARAHPLRVALDDLILESGNRELERHGIDLLRAPRRETFFSPTFRSVREVFLLSRAASAEPLPSLSSDGKGVFTGLLEGNAGLLESSPELSTVVVHAAEESRDEVSYAVRAIREIMSREGAAAGEFQIIVSNLARYQRALEDELAQAKLDHVILRGEALSVTPVGSLLLSLLSFLSEGSEASIRALYTAPGISLPAATVEQIAAFTERYRTMLDAAFGDATVLMNGVSSGNGPGVGEVFDLFAELGIEAPESADPSAAIAVLLRKIGPFLSEVGEGPDTRLGRRATKILHQLRGLASLEAVLEQRTRRLAELEALDSRKRILLIRAWTRELLARAPRTSPRRRLRALALVELRRVTHRTIRYCTLPFVPNSDVAELCTMLADATRRAFCNERYRPDAVLVTELLDARAARGKRVLFIGLNAEHFPLRSSESAEAGEFDGIKSEIDRLSARPERSVFESYYLLGFVLRNSASLLITYSRAGKGGESGVNPIISGISALAQKAPALPEALFLEPRDVSGRRIAALVRARSSPLLTAFDGLVGEEGIAVGHAVHKLSSEGENAYAPSALERFAKCPSCFFFDRVLGLEETSVSLEDRKALHAGNLVHRVLAEFARKRIPTAERVTHENFEECQAEILRLALEAFAVSPFDWDHDPVLRLERRRILLGLEGSDVHDDIGLLKRALMIERDYLPGVPRAIELGFMGNEALRIAAERGTIKLSGRIDRVNVDGEAFSVWDYKTGTTVHGRPDVFAGRSLQVGIYALAVRQLLGALPTRGGQLALAFSFLSGDKGGPESIIRGALREQLAVAQKDSKMHPELVLENIEMIKTHLLRHDSAIRRGAFHLDLEKSDICESCADYGRDGAHVRRPYKTSGTRDLTLRKAFEQGAFSVREGAAPQRVRSGKGSSSTLSPTQEQAAAIDRNIALSAGAGSGKTRVLVSRMTRLILAGADIRSIVAITYTRKSAWEMRRRLEEMLAETLFSGVFEGRELTSTERNRVLESRFFLSEAVISTIHVFCQTIVSAAPELSGLSPDFRLVPSGELIALRDEVRQQVLRRSFFDERSPIHFALNFLIDGGLTFYWLDKMISQLVARRLQLEELCRTFELESALFSLEGASDGARRVWHSLAAAGPSDTSEADFQRSRAALAVARHVTSMLDLRKRELGLADFDDLVVASHELLLGSGHSERRTEVCSRLKGRFKHFLVDEFQDTDILQWEIINALSTVTEPNEFRTLFFVGDPKQGIYGFRGGDLRVFKRAVEELTAGGGSVHSLSENYRSHGEIIAHVNEAFETRFQSDFGEDGLPHVSTAVTFEPLDARRSSPFDDQRVHTLPDEDQVVEVARLVRAMLEEVLSNPPAEERKYPGLKDQGDSPLIAILCRSHQKIDEIASAFDEAGVPYSVSRSKGFFALEEIRACEHLFRYLAARHDHAALVSFLRSPLFGLSDLDLCHLHAELGGDWGRIASPDARGTIATEVSSRMATMLSHAAEAPPSVLLSTVVQEAQLRQILPLCGFPERIRNLDRLIDWIAERERSGAISLERGISYAGVVNLFEMSQLDDREGPDAAHGDAPVVLMTIHNAKGLEFPVVILPFLDATQAIHDPFYVGEAADQARVLALRISSDEQKGDASEGRSIPALVKASHGKIMSAETNRVAYVAYTRAKEYLFIGGKAKRKAKSTSETTPDSASADAPRKTGSPRKKNVAAN